MFFNKLHSILINSFLNNLFDLKSCGETSSKKSGISLLFFTHSYY